jgi:ribosomal protein S18 acetylase RimI-like enzyme
MATTFFKRFRMELPLRGDLPAPKIPNGFFWVPWQESLIDLHAEVHFRAFKDTIDATVFSSFREPAACWYLLREIRAKPGFMPEATWIVACPTGCCGSIQCITVQRGRGQIQNVGVLAEYRGQGLGEALVLQALQAFKAARLTRAELEVTADNTPAVQLYQRLGFRKMKTTYKEVLA